MTKKAEQEKAAIVVAIVALVVAVATLAVTIIGLEKLGRRTSALLTGEVTNNLMVKNLQKCLKEGDEKACEDFKMNDKTFGTAVKYFSGD